MRQEKPRAPRKRSLSDSGWQKYEAGEEDQAAQMASDQFNAEALKILERIKQFKKELVASTPLPKVLSLAKVSLLIPFSDSGSSSKQNLNSDAYAADHAYTVSTKCEPKSEPNDWTDSEMSRSESEPKFDISYFLGADETDKKLEAKLTDLHKTGNIDYWLEYYGMQNRRVYVQTPRIDDIKPFKTNTIKLRDLKKYSSDKRALLDCKIPRKRSASKGKVATASPPKVTTSPSPKRPRTSAEQPKKPRGRRPKSKVAKPATAVTVSQESDHHSDLSPVIKLQQELPTT